MYYDMYGCFLWRYINLKRDVIKEYETAMHIYMLWYINTMGVVEHERGLRGKHGIAKCFSDFSSALLLPECLYHSI
jgi:hypothetical protein